MTVRGLGMQTQNANPPTDRLTKALWRIYRMALDQAATETEEAIQDQGQENAPAGGNQAGQEEGDLRYERANLTS